MQKYRLLDLFSGIGGFSLGLERSSGFETVVFCEIDPYCRRVLAKNWPKVPQYDDICTLTADRLASDGIRVNAICGGFPCQDLSLAGNGAGLDGARSGLWFEYLRLIDEIRPEIVVVENVTALLGRGMGVVLGGLAALGYDAEWHCIPASHIGAYHQRDRVWIVAYPDSRRRRSDIAGGDDADRHDAERTQTDGMLGTGGYSSGAKGLAYANKINAQGEQPWRCHDKIVWREQIERQARLCRGAGPEGIWAAESAVGRVAHGIPKRVDRLGALGNSVVPQIPELIGRAILEHNA